MTAKRGLIDFSGFVCFFCFFFLFGLALCVKEKGEKESQADLCPLIHTDAGASATPSGFALTSRNTRYTLRPTLRILNAH